MRNVPLGTKTIFDELSRSKNALLRNKQFAKVVFRSNFYGGRSAIISSAMIACLGGTKVSRTDQIFSRLELLELGIDTENY
jgi:hypothetical protein